MYLLASGTQELDLHPYTDQNVFQCGGGFEECCHVTERQPFFAFIHWSVSLAMVLHAGIEPINRHFILENEISIKILLLILTVN